MKQFSMVCSRRARAGFVSPNSVLRNSRCGRAELRDANCRGTNHLKTAKGGRTNHRLRPESSHHHTWEGHTCSRAKKDRKIPALAAEVVALHDLGPQGLK